MEQKEHPQYDDLTMEQYEVLYNEAEKNTPKTVWYFLFSPTFSEVVKKIGEWYKLTPEQIASLEIVIRDGFLEILDPEDIRHELTVIGIKEELHDDILELAYQYCVQPAMDTLDGEDAVNMALAGMKMNEDGTIEDENGQKIGEDQQTVQPAKKRPTSEVFQSISAQLTTSKATLPTTTDYSLKKDKPVVDPYREQF